MSELHVVVGGQYGSEGKGAVVAHLARTARAPLLVVRVGGPNAGHTVYDDQGRRYPLRQVPAGVVLASAQLAIAAGSEVDPAVLWGEVSQLEANGVHVRHRLTVDPMATVLEREHVEQGERERRRGSTGKGVGVVRAARVRRQARVVRDIDEGSLTQPPWPGRVRSVAPLVREHLASGGDVIVEGTQGYGLGLFAPWYPFTTSGGCTAMDMLAQAQVPPWTTQNLQVWVVLRTCPIRVAGDSGPMRHETSWEELGAESGGHIKPEHTTVTQKVRRVARWDRYLASAAVEANGGPPAVRAALMMFDYWFPETAHQRVALARGNGHLERLVQVEREIGCRIELIGTGPETIVDRRPR